MVMPFLFAQLEQNATRNDGSLNRSKSSSPSVKPKLWGIIPVGETANRGRADGGTCKLHSDNFGRRQCHFEISRLH